MIRDGTMYCESCKAPVQLTLASVVVHFVNFRIEHYHYFCLVQRLNRGDP
jgi:hypothetical protein